MIFVNSFLFELNDFLVNLRHLCPTLFLGIIFVMGLLVGSFLNSWIYRTETGSTPWKGRSFCPHCKTTLKTKDLIPVLSFILLKGRCRYCGQRISFQYPLVELATAGMFLLGFLLRRGLFSLEFLFVTPFLILIFVYDLKHYLIPDKFIYPLLGIVLFFQQARGWNNLKQSLFWGGVLATMFFLIWLFSRGRWLGFGDVEIALFMGLWLKNYALIAFLLACFAGGIIGIMMIVSGTKELKSAIPFGPFLVAGTVAVFFWGTQIVDFYLKLAL